MEDDDPEKRIRELERGISGQGHPPPPPMHGWENYTSQPAPPPRGPMVVKKSGLRLLPLVVIVTALVVPLIVGVSIWFSTANPFASKPQLHTADGLTGLIASIRDKFGDTTGYQLVVYPEYADLDRASSSNAHAKQNFIYRGDDWGKWAPDTSLSSFDHLADLSAFDPAGVSATIATAPQKLGINDATATYLIVRGEDGGDVKLSVYVSAPATGWMEITPTGDVVKLHPPGG